MAAVALLFLIATSTSTLTQVGADEFLGRRLDLSYVDSVIQHSLAGILGNGHGVHDNRLTMINSTLAPLFNTLPKNEYGRLSTPSMRYAVQRYFSQRHGWVVKGFEPHSNSSDSAGPTAQILQGKIPSYIEGVLTQTLSKGGFALADVAIVVATIERLIFDETLKALEFSYSFRNESTISSLNQSSLMTVLVSYFILEHLSGSVSSAEQHLNDAAQLGSFYPHWNDTMAFMQDIVGEDAFLRQPLQNPFMNDVLFDFPDVTRIAGIISDRFGAFSNHECQDMKTRLLKLDAHGTGRLKLSAFYATGQFLESSLYLEQLGALDTSSEWQGPQVIVSNYLVGINNCISTGAYYDVCCLNECDGIFQHLEARIKTPTASAAQIAQAIEEGIALTPHLSASAPTEARNLSAALQERLAQIEAHHEGQIPLHGRLLAQWLHYAFPRECPFPHLKGTVERYYNTSLMSVMKVTEEEMVRHIKSEHGRRKASPEAGVNMWTLQEELLDRHYVAPTSTLSRLRSVPFIIVLIGMLGMVTKEVMKFGNLGLTGSEKGKVKDAAPEVSYYI